MSNRVKPKNTGPAILFIDIETSPNLAYVWRLFKENVSLAQLQETGQVISFAAKWRGRKTVEFYSDFHDGHDVMIRKAHELMDAADMIVHYNGKTFDMPHLHREFLLAKMNPPSPHKDIDLLQIMKRRFRFVSNKLDHVTQELGQKGKVRHTGFALWDGCMKNDPASWALMRRYNRGDVTELEELYDRVLPWIHSHPHVGLYADSGVETCARCGSTDLRKEGRAYTQLGVYQRYQCRGCGSWSRAGKRLANVDIRGVH